MQRYFSSLQYFTLGALFLLAADVPVAALSNRRIAQTSTRAVL